jgi:hypothetical protein
VKERPLLGTPHLVTGADYHGGVSRPRSQAVSRGARDRLSVWTHKSGFPKDQPDLWTQEGTLDRAAA